ncbi:MAG: amidohydrolase family protein [Pseudomonadales bacterium]|nr:amidohydrolase family protein [Pseudomonadales bacterium]
MTDQTLLITNAALLLSSGRPTNIAVSGGYITAIGQIAATGAERVIDAKGGLLIPGLHDHHVHLISYAASLESVRCGPPEVLSEQALIQTLNNQPGKHWLRGIGYHESVLPNLDRDWLDSNGPDRPIRIQHRSGRLWVLNSQALEIIEDSAADLAHHEEQRLASRDGRLYDVDELLGSLMIPAPPPVDIASQQLAAFGITGINDMTPSNDADTWNWFSELQTSGQLLQKVRLSGRPELTNYNDIGDSLTVGETKIHLHDSSLPDFHELIEIINTSHQRNRPVAVHCVTEIELVFTLSAFSTAGTRQGDRIEHASVVPPALVQQLRELKLGVVTQPNFIYERGDAYLDDIDSKEHSDLYRCGSLIDAGIPVAFGTDLPFGNPDPWVAIKAAISRETASGEHLGIDECINLDTALPMFLGSLSQPFKPRSIALGQPADCCLLDVPLQGMASDLSSAHVRMTIRDGKTIYARGSLDEN